MARGIGKETIARIDLVVAAGVNAKQGEIALGNPATGMVVAGAPTAGLVRLGWFFRDHVGDGVSKCPIQLPREITVARFKNSSSDPIEHAFQGAYVESPDTLCDVNTAARWGLTYEVDATTVLAG